MHNKTNIELYLLHFAGGNQYSFNFLKDHMPSSIDFIPLELPGRGKRFSEALIKNKEEAISDYLRQFLEIRNSNKPYIVFGHSMGATLGLSLVNKLEKLNNPPISLIVSGNSGPGTYDDAPKRYLLEDEEFKKELRRLGGVPEEVLGNDELFNYFSPIIRADFETLENCGFIEKNIKINSPIYALMGSEEEKKDKITNWQNFTKSEFHYQIVEGNHFFIQKHPKEIATIIMNVLNKNIIKKNVL